LKVIGLRTTSVGHYFPSQPGKILINPDFAVAPARFFLDPVPAMSQQLLPALLYSFNKYFSF
jgi:hypothetical protein